MTFRTNLKRELRPHLPTSDQLLSVIDHSMRTLAGVSSSGRAMPTALIHAETAEVQLTDDERRLSGALMRVNHVGEICAQALYQSQSLTARSPELRTHMAQAAREESDHLAWTQARLDALGDRPSLLNPLWYAGSFAIGLAAGALGDRISLGFVVETEHQVEEHLASHLDHLPARDASSRAVVEQMKADEAEHARAAQAAGAFSLPTPIRGLMRLTAKVMTRTAHYI